MTHRQICAALDRLEDAGTVWSWDWEYEGHARVYFIWHDHKLDRYTRREAVALIKNLR